jgi:hypothetical protein
LPNEDKQFARIRRQRAGRSWGAIFGQLNGRGQRTTFPETANAVAAIAATGF